MERTQLKEQVSELAALVRRAQGGDEDALPLIIHLTEQRLYRFLLFLTADPPLASDLSQDVYLYLFQNLKKVTDPEAFLHWLFLVAKNKFLDHKKSPRNKPHDDVDRLDRVDPGAGPEKRELVMQVRQSFSRLEADDRLILVLVDIEGYTVAEAAEFLKISTSAATSRVRRARETFHKNYFGPDKK